jgi:DNA polymerase I-like protein with 3'-5' exonuclease and polymerase domains
MNQLESSPLMYIIVDEVRSASPEVFGIFSVYQWESLRSKILRAGFSLNDVRVVLLSTLLEIPKSPVIVGLGEKTLTRLTEKHGIDKWQLSPFTLDNGSTFLPTFDMTRAQKQYELGFFQELTFHRAYEYAKKPRQAAIERFHLNPPLGEAIEILRSIKDEPEIAVDVETGYGQINTVGFAWSESDAIAINVLPDRCGDIAYYELWKGINDVLSGGSRKIFQNFIYDTSYFQAYGIRIEGEIFDTMWAMKVLYPEFKSNLGNVGRVFTKRTYWKDDGKVTDEEGKKKNWGDVRDWPRHYTYNCRDTTGTLESSRAQRAEIESRGLSEFYFRYLSRLIEPIREMCRTGMPLDLTVRDKIKNETEEKVAQLTKEFHEKVGRDLNPRSPKQVQNYLKEKNIVLPKKYDKETETYRESADSASLKKIRLKRPELTELGLLADIKSLDKALSSYINFTPRHDGRVSYSLNGAGTETLRWSGSKDPWDRGFNIQTIPREGGDVSIKSMFVSPAGQSFLEIDLRQAESRFVAYDSADSVLIDMLESGSDVHTHVGNAILKQMGRDPSVIPKEEFKSTWRQLGKKAGHGLNYGMKPKVFVETVFNELDIVISTKDAELITQAYYNLFPGIPRWHSWIRNELYTKRKLTAPSGWERYFYGRPGDDMLKEGLAWRPQHTIPWITNHLMLHLAEWRKTTKGQFRFVAQVHDSLIMLVPDDELNDLAQVCLNYKLWHPQVTLSGGQMMIPTEAKAGKCMADLKEIHP